MGRWCRQAISELDFDFERYGSEHFERLLSAAAGTGLRGVACGRVSSPTALAW